jgi:hypothetical protein
MADFKFFTLGVGITVIVLGAAIGAVSGAAPSPPPAKTAMSHMTSTAKHNANKQGMTPTASAASSAGTARLPPPGPSCPRQHRRAAGAGNHGAPEVA